MECIINIIPLIYDPIHLIAIQSWIFLGLLKCKDPFSEMDNDWIFPIYLLLPLPTFRHSSLIRSKLFPFHLEPAPDVFTFRWFLAISGPDAHALYSLWQGHRHQTGFQKRAAYSFDPVCAVLMQQRSELNESERKWHCAVLVELVVGGKGVECDRGKLPCEYNTLLHTGAAPRGQCWSNFAIEYTLKGPEIYLDVNSVKPHAVDRWHKVVCGKKVLVSVVRPRAFCWWAH